MLLFMYTYIYIYNVDAIYIHVYINIYIMPILCMYLCLHHHYISDFFVFKSVQSHCQSIEPLRSQNLNNQNKLKRLQSWTRPDHSSKWITSNIISCKYKQHLLKNNLISSQVQESQSHLVWMSIVCIIVQFGGFGNTHCLHSSAEQCDLLETGFLYYGKFQACTQK